MNGSPGATMMLAVDLARLAPATGVSAKQVNEALSKRRKDGAQLESAIRDVLQRCVVRGLLWTGCRVGDVKRWFISAELADAWASLPAVRKPTRQLPMRQRVALPAQPAQVLLDAAPVAVPRPVMTASGACYVPGMALSRSELQAGRVTARPPGEPFGAGFTAAGIGRDAMTGRAWG